MLDETTTTPAIVDAISGAKHVVNAEFFGITDAGKGAQLTTALADAAGRGVEVNVIADFVSTMALPLGSFQRMQDRIEDSGGNVVVTSRVPFSPRVREHPGLRHVDHRKVVTVDGTTGFVGGMNFIPLTDDYKDTMVQLQGLPAARLAADQLDRWSRVGGKVTPGHAASVEQALAGRELVPSDPRELRIVANAPEQRRFEVSDGYRDLIRGARERLWISSPGISDREIMRDVHDAARRGVDVRIVASGKPPVRVPLVNWVGRAHLADLVDSGGAAFEIPETLHRKAIVADDEAILSSYNLTGRSRRFDHEVGIRTADPDFVAAVAATLEHDMARGNPFDPSEHTSLPARLGELIADHITY